MKDLFFSESLEMNPDLLKEHASGDDAEGNARTLDEVFETDEESMSVPTKQKKR